MFGPAYFGVTHYGPTYFPPAGADLDIGPQPGGGTGKKSKRHVPGITSNRAIAMREDEELMAMLEAYFGTRRH